MTTFPLPAIEAVVLTLPEEPYDLGAIDLLARHWSFITRWLPWRTNLAIRFNPVLHFAEGVWQRPQLNPPGARPSPFLVDLVAARLGDLGFLDRPQYTVVAMVQGAGDVGWAWGAYWDAFYSHKVGIAVVGESVLGPILAESGRLELNRICGQFIYPWACTYARALWTIVHEIGHAAFGLDHGELHEDRRPHLMLDCLSPGDPGSPNFLSRHMNQVIGSPYVFGTSNLTMPFPLLPGMTNPPKFPPGTQVVLPANAAPLRIMGYPLVTIEFGRVYWYASNRVWGYTFRTADGQYVTINESDLLTF